MTLNDMKTGESGKVMHVAGNGPVRRRLFDLGIHPGGSIKMIKAAPLRDPLEIAIDTGHLSIRRKEAALIDVELID